VDTLELETPEMRPAVKPLTLLLCALWVIPAYAKKAEYSEVFTVVFAVRQPGQTLGDTGSCAMHLASGNRVYSVYTVDGFTKPCAIFPLGTVLRGRDMRRFDEMIELLDDTGDKPKARRYFVRDVVER
jgi:hypothetical protein